MQVYLVGGAVRDELLGRPVHERDWVVVGATAEEMSRAGYLQVGRDFPVFLHPRTREEHALARRERKVAPGYRGFVTEFSPDVSLEEDLQRRDLTINAMARLPDGALVDPYGGQHDLHERLVIESIYDEVQRTGKVVLNLPEDDRAVRQFYADEVLKIPLTELDAQPAGIAGSLFGQGAAPRSNPNRFITAPVIDNRSGSANLLRYRGGRVPGVGGRESGAGARRSA